MGQNIILPKHLPLIKDFNLKNLSSIKVGGPARYFFKPKTLIELKNSIDFANDHGIKVKCLGNCTNVVFSDGGYNGLVLALSNLKGVSKKSNVLTFTAGESLRSVFKIALSNGLTGAEYFSNIPATIGGATVSNAGAFDHQVSELVTFVQVIENGIIKFYDNKQCNFSYRNSIFKGKNIPIIKVEMSFEKGDYQKIISLEKELSLKRKLTQPMGLSCGSTFKNPQNYKAGKLIEQSGLKGYALGDAIVSTKHANFILNNGNATAKNIYDLANLVKNKVFEDTGIMLKEEIEFIGEF